MINSYENQRHNICDEINYFDYFDFFNIHMVPFGPLFLEKIKVRLDKINSYLIPIESALSLGEHVRSDEIGYSTGVYTLNLILRDISEISRYINSHRNFHRLFPCEYEKLLGFISSIQKISAVLTAEHDSWGSALAVYFDLMSIGGKANNIIVGILAPGTVNFRTDEKTCKFFKEYNEEYIKKQRFIDRFFEAKHVQDIVKFKKAFGDFRRKLESSVSFLSQRMVEIYSNSYMIDEQINVILSKYGASVEPMYSGTSFSSWTHAMETSIEDIVSGLQSLNPTVEALSTSAEGARSCKDDLVKSAEELVISMSGIKTILKKDVVCYIEGVKERLQSSILGGIEGTVLILKQSISNLLGKLRKLPETKEILKFLDGEIKQIPSEVESLVLSFLDLSIRYLGCDSNRVTKEGMDYNQEVEISYKNVPTSGKISGDKKITDRLIISVLSHMTLLESKFVLSKLFECSKKVDDVLIVLNRVEYCNCVDLYKSVQNPPYYQHVLFAFSYEIVHKHLHHGMLPEKEVSDDGNHLCLCLVIKFYLYPTIVKCLCLLIDIDLDILSTLSRKFEKYTKKDTFYIDSSKLFTHIIDVLVKITYWIRESNRWKRCFCTKPDDVYYKFFISTMIYISFFVENMFDPQNETTGDSIQSLSILIDELSSTGHPTKDKCQSEQQVGESQSTSSQQQGENLCHSAQTNNIMLVELYKSLASIFGQNIYLLKFGGVYFLLGLKLLVDQLSNVVSILDPMISYNFNNWIVGYFVSIKETIIIHKDKGSELLSFYQFFSMLSFTLINSKCLCETDKRKVKEVTVLVSSVYISIVSKKKEQKKENECFFKEPADRTLVASCISLIYYWYNNLSLQLSNKVVLDFMEYSEDCKKDKTGYYLTRRTISYPENMCKYSRTNRIVDSTSGISNTKFEGVSNNNYAYNDAYRINTSRAHGILIFPVHYCKTGPRLSTFSLLILLYYWLWIHLNISGNKR